MYPIYHNEKLQNGDLFVRKLSSKVDQPNPKRSLNEEDITTLINSSKLMDNTINIRKCILYGLNLLLLLITVTIAFSFHANQSTELLNLEAVSRYSSTTKPVVIAPIVKKQPVWKDCLDSIPPQGSRKHIVPPPNGPVTIVCCNTTKGILNIEVHKSWAPIGANHFLKMVRLHFFESKVALFRALKGFLVQFGLSGDPEIQKTFHKMGNLNDDPSWLPLGPSGRERNGIKRFQKGYLAYAGAGNNSRGTQLIMSFEDNLYLGGGCPWEVPFGQLIGNKSFDTLSKIYTGYNEKPSQGKIMNQGIKYVEREFPLMDYITNCSITAEDLPWEYHPER